MCQMVLFTYKNIKLCFVLIFLLKRDISSWKIKILDLLWWKVRVDVNGYYAQDLISK